jgi:uncharacterized membrane protein YfcA
MGGPPLVLWVTAHNWTADQMRAFLFACFMSIAPFQMVAYYWNFGNQIIYGVLLAIIFLPIVLLGSSLGLQIGTHFSKGVLKNLAFSLLIIISISVMLPYLNR